jgi:N-acetylated-alpha-linked acidic dipeptidase
MLSHKPVLFVLLCLFAAASLLPLPLEPQATLSAQEANERQATNEREASLLGFSKSGRADYLRLEDLAAKVPTPDRARQLLRVLTEEPHVAGTPEDYETAVYVRDRLRECGVDAQLVEYRVLLNYPGHVAARVTLPKPADIPLREPGDVRDKDSFSQSGFPGFHGYGASGKAAGQVVYVNYGRPEDFKKLEDLGIDVKGKIVLARYGELFRGLKVKNAQDRGAAGVLIYSDPADDGYMKGDVYPDGPFRSEGAIQRGSVQFLSLGPGDPTTPGWASTDDARRIPYEELESMARIPSLPLSYGAARPILEALAGPNVPEGWQGGLPFAYHVGPGPAEVEIEVEMDYAIRPTWNVIGTINGTEALDEWVIMGNHRDAWGYGAVDPNSGTTAMLETARALGEAMKAGWQPRRSILFASWGAEEYGLVGSTEWGEEHAEELGRKAVLVLNADSAVAGAELDLNGVPSLRDLILSAAAEVHDPHDGDTLKSKWLKAQRKQWAENGTVSLDEPDAPFVPQLGAVGSGSDYTVFLDHLGVPVLDVDFRGHYGVYHSLYDNFYWMEKFGDPGFVYHRAAAELYTRLLMRAASAELAPLRFEPYAAALAEYRDELKRRVIRKRRAMDGVWVPNSRIGTRTFYVRESSTIVGLADFGPADEAIEAFRTAAIELDQAAAEAQSLQDLDAEKLTAANRALIQIERRFLNDAGLPERPWFRHLVYAPGLTTGYAAWPLPGLRQSTEEDDPELFEQEMPRLVAALEAATEAVNEAKQAIRALVDP